MWAKESRAIVSLRKDADGKAPGSAGASSVCCPWRFVSAWAGDSPTTSCLLIFSRWATPCIGRDSFSRVRNLRLFRDTVISLAAVGGAYPWMLGPAVNLLAAFAFGVAVAIWFLRLGRDDSDDRS